MENSTEIKSLDDLVMQVYFNGEPVWAPECKVSELPEQSGDYIIEGDENGTILKTSLEHEITFRLKAADASGDYTLSFLGSTPIRH